MDQKMRSKVMERFKELRDSGYLKRGAPGAALHGRLEAAYRAALRAQEIAARFPKVTRFAAAMLGRPSFAASVEREKAFLASIP